MSKKIIVGNAEIINLPELNLQGVNVRVDTGAKTSCLHAELIHYDANNGKPIVEFVLNAEIYQLKKNRNVELPLVDSRWIKSSNGSKEKRYVVKTMMELGDRHWQVEFTLTDRSDMNYPILLGREGMGKHLIVDPSVSYLVNR